MTWLLRIFFALVLLGLLAAGALFLIPADRVAALAARQIEAATGRAVTIAGGAAPSLWPHLGVSTGRVQLANAPWGTEGPMLTAEALSVRLDTAALLRGAIRITGIEAEAPRVVLERARDGRGNWEIGNAAAPPGTPDPAAREVSVERVVLREAALRFVDHGTGQRLSLDDVSADLRLPDPAGPLSVAATARIDGRLLSVEGRIAGFAALMEGAVGGIDLRGTLGRNTLSFDGRAGLSPTQAEGQLTLNLADPTALRGLVPPLPEGLGRNRAELAGQLTVTPQGGVHLRGSEAVLDGNRLSFDADLLPGPDRPRLVARISAADLTLPQTGGGGGAGAASAGWPDAPLGLGALGALDADVTLSAQSLTLAPVRFGPVRARIALEAARAVVSIDEAAAWGGRLAGTVVLNGRGGGSARADLRLTGAQVRPMLSELAGYDRLISEASIAFNLLGSGASVRALVSSLAGDGRVTLGQGELRGLDLAGMLRRMDLGHVGEGQRTIFDAVTGSFTIERGILLSEDFVLIAPLLRASGVGTVSLPDRTLDWRIVPTALPGEDGTGGLRVPLIVSGPWAAPNLRLDLRAIADPRIEAEKARAEARAREALAREAERRLGVTPEEGERMEDAVKRRLEQEALRGLGRLLGGN
ncbi:MAG: AsmA family protein [Gemmobacter sp.]